MRTNGVRDDSINFWSRADLSIGSSLAAACRALPPHCAQPDMLRNRMPFCPSQLSMMHRLSQNFGVIRDEHNVWVSIVDIHPGICRSGERFEGVILIGPADQRTHRWWWAILGLNQ